MDKMRMESVDMTADNIELCFLIALQKPKTKMES